MGLHGAWIVTKRYGGFLDTIPENAGRLFRNDDLARSIVEGLRKSDYDPMSYRDYCKEHFSVESVLPKWLALFDDIAKGKDVIIDRSLTNNDYNFKKFKELNRRIKKAIPFGYKLPTVEWYINVLNKLFHLRIEHHTY